MVFFFQLLLCVILLLSKPCIVIPAIFSTGGILLPVRRLSTYVSRDSVESNMALDSLDVDLCDGIRYYTRQPVD